MDPKKRREIIQANTERPTIPAELITKQRGRSIFIRHLDCGSCNACELELNALVNPVYDIAQYGIHFEASPRHADVLAMTGCFTRSLKDAALATVEAMPVPRIITVGDCAKDDGIFKDSYAVTHRPVEIENAIIAHVEGCPPSPQKILQALLDLSLRKD